MNSQGSAPDGTEGALQYLATAAAQSQPFFMVVSLVNPHDVLFYPKNYMSDGYDSSWLQGEIEPPATAFEDLSTKPTVQAEFRRIFDLSGPIPTPQMKRNYLNFCGNLMKSSDAYLVQILDTLTSAGLLDNTLVIATADHGEMGTTHGGMRQKNFNFYEESIRVPSSTPAPDCSRRRRRATPSCHTSTFCRPSRVSSARRRRPARTGRGSITQIRSSARHPSRGRTTQSSPTTTSNPDRRRAPTLKTDPLERTNLAFKHHRRTAEEQRQPVAGPSRRRRLGMEIRARRVSARERPEPTRVWWVVGDLLSVWTECDCAQLSRCA
jgi:sulfatase-like protein